MSRDTRERYGTVSRLLHWGVALLVVWQVLKIFDRIDDGEHWVGQTLVPWHISIGFVILLLMLVRITWALRNHGNRPPAPQPRMLGLVAKAGHVALYAALVLMPVSGMSIMIGNGYGLTVFGMELVAQGAANIITPLFGGIPATGAIARTATNVKNGGRTPVAGIVHAVTLLAITLFFGGLAAHIPFAALGAILVIVAYHMSEWRSFRALLRAPRSDVLVLLTTFGLTVLVDLTVAIQVGMVLAAFLFMRRMAEVTNVQSVTRELAEPSDDPYLTDTDAVARREVPPRVEVYEINGPFFFGAAEMFRERVSVLRGRPEVLIIRMRNVPAIDATGLHALAELVRRSRRNGVRVMLSDVHAQPLFAIERARMAEELGEDGIFGNLDDALDAARVQLGLPQGERPPGAQPTVRRERKE